MENTNHATLYRRTVNYYETDQMGIVHHSNYIRYFEEARLDMMNQLALNYRTMEEMGLIIPVLSVECRYLQPLRYEDEIEIYSRLIKFDGIKMEVSYEIYEKKSEQLCTTGNSGHCFLNREMKPVRMKRVYPELYQRLKALTEA